MKFPWLKQGRSDVGSDKRRIFIPLIAYALLAALVFAGFLLYLRNDAVASGKTLLSALAQLTDEQTSSIIESIDHTLAAVEATVSVATDTGPPGEETFQAKLHKLLDDRRYLKVIGVVDSRGREIYGSDSRHVGVDLSDQEYFSFHRDHRGPAFRINSPIRSLTGGWVIPVSRERTLANGDFAGVIYAGLDPKFFEQSWTLDSRMADLSTTLIRQDGMLLMRSPFIERSMGVSIGAAPDFYRIGLGERSGAYQATSVFDGKQRLLAFRRLQAYPSLVVVVGQSLDQVLAAWWQLVWIVVGCWAATAVALGSLAVWRIREGKARRATETRYQMLFEANPYSMVAIEPDTRRILAINNAAVEEYGWSRKEALGMRADDLYPPEDLLLAKKMRGKPLPDHVRGLRGLHLRKKDGTVIDVEMTQRAIELDGRPALLTAAHDVTEQVRAEQARRASEDLLRQAQKMEAVGQLTGGIAHDFNNILMVILSNVDALLDANLPAETAKRVDEIDIAAVRASDLTRQLLAFSRKQALHPQQTDLNDLVTETGKLLHRSLGAQIDIETILAGGLCIASVDRAQLGTALINLCVNARDAMPEGGRLLIETQNVILDGEFVSLNPGATAGANAMLSVTDTGCGIAPDVLGKVFEPFFTTKDVGKGTGLGLSMVYGFIKQSKGYVAISSEVGRGTSVRLYLPCSGEVAESEIVAKEAAIQGGTERILVVEDEPMVGASVVQQLRSLGYAASEMANGAAGIAAFEAALQPYDLLLTDVVMPGRLNGKLLAAEVVRRWPKTKVVFMSGFTETSGASHGQLDEGALLLNKPFRKTDLARMIRRTLDGVGPPEGASAKAASY